MDEHTNDDENHIRIDASKVDWSTVTNFTNGGSSWGPISVGAPKRYIAYTIPRESTDAILNSMNNKDADLWLSTPSGVAVAGPLFWNDAISQGIALTSESPDTLVMHNGEIITMALFHNGKAFIQVTLGEG